MVKSSIGLAAGFAVLLFAAVITHCSTTDLVENSERVSHTYEVIALIEDLEDTIDRLQAQKRAFTITGDEQLLVDFYHLVQRAGDDHRSLRALTADNVDHQRHLEQLWPLIQQRLAAITEHVAWRRTHVFDLDAEVANIRSGIALTTRIVDGLDALRARERGFLKAREQDTARSLRVERGIQIGGLVASMALFAVTFSQLRRENRRRRDSEEAERAFAREIGEANRFLDSIVENVPNMLFVKNAGDLRFVRFNRAGEELIGATRENLIGKSDRDLFPEDQAADFEAKDREVLANRVVVDIPEEPIDTKSGKRWLHTRKIPITDADDKPRFLLGISEDITERKRLADDLRAMNEDLEARVRERSTALEQTERQLQQSQKMEGIGRLAGGIAHDFNNLLSVILSYTEMLLEDMSSDDVKREDITEIHKAGLRAADLTRQLLAFSRQQVLAPKVLNLNSIVAGMEKLLRRVIGEDIELRIATSADLDQVKVDPGQMEQVIMNLIVNARDAMPRGGRVTIETANVELDETYAAGHPDVSPGPHTMLAVSDSGVGMDRETQTRIFEPFFTTKPKGKGTGLGLSTVFGIVRQSGGSIWVYSEPGVGSTFKVYLPSTRSAPTAEDRTLAATRHRGSETILLVEDEEQVRTLARGILARAGYQVIEATDGQDALAMCARFSGSIHLIVTDVVMPRLGGRQLVEQIATTRPDTKVLFMSGYTDDMVVHHGVIDEGLAFLQKPITPDALLRKVREVLGQAPRRPSSTKLQ